MACWFLGVTLVLVSIWGAVILKEKSHRIEAEIARCFEIEEKARALGIAHAPLAIKERHVRISERVYAPGRHGDIPVHIMFRRHDEADWLLVGTGTRLGKFPNSVLTAYHVFENRPGQYGIRRVGTNEFSGKEKIMPVVLWNDGGNGGDTISCAFDEDGQTYPLISVPTSTNMFREWDANRTYPTRVYRVGASLLTYPNQPISTVLDVEVGPGTHHLFFDADPVPGESGTSGELVGDMDPENYLVVIQVQPISSRVISRIKEGERHYVNWRPGKLYGVGVLIKVAMPVPLPLSTNQPKG